MTRLTTLHISQNAIKYMVFRDTEAVAWGTVPLTGAVKNGHILDTAAVSRQFKNLIASGKVPADRIICSLNGLPFSYRFFTLPKMDATSVDEAITRMAKQEMPLAPEDMILSWRAYPGEKGDHQYLVTGITRRPVDALIKTFSAAGIKPYIMCLPQIVLASLSKQEDVIIIDAEPDSSNITLVAHGVPAGMHTVPSSNPEANLQDITGQLIRELTRMADFYNDNHPRNPIPDTTKILLTGELANEPEIAALLQSKTGYAVDTFKELPANTLVIPPEVPLAAYAVNIGAAMYNMMPSPTSANNPAFVREINLANIISEQSISTKVKGSNKKWILCAVLAIGVISLAAAFVFQYQASGKISQLTTELQQVNHQLAQKQNAARQAVTTETNIKQILSATQQLKNDYLKVLNPRDIISDINLLTQSMPPGTTFKIIDMNSVQISINGITTTQERVIEYVKSLEFSGAFSSASIIWMDRASNTGASIAFLIVIIR
jgi:Tfp pilus assembly PilM family ATPase/Tfp pilus assembly protein PilN